MRAITIARPGGPEVLTMSDVAVPEPGPHEIRVRVHATAVNRADLLQRAGNYPAPKGSPQNIPGLEYSGTVDGVGEGVRRWRDGDRVMGLVGGGSYAEYITTHEDEAIRVPDALSLENAAAIPEAFITAHDALFTRMKLQPRESLLIHAVGSGVGTAALQIAKAHDVFVLGTQRSAWKLERAQALGLDVAIEADDGAFAERAVQEAARWRAERRGAKHDVREGAQQAESGFGDRHGEPAHTDDTARPGVDGILDLVGGPYLAGNLRAIRVLGRIVVAGLVAGAKHELDMRLLLQKRATITGTVLRARTLAEKIEAARAFERDVLPLIASGAVRPIVDEVLPVGEAAQAHRIVGENRNFGKVVLVV
ncbi:MAG TPA: NAD(P)H-quinone oxidoreductase [Longimicrobiales bacterium]|nr:NAD(P)H-quinone oxidoreductase [Longimicrobiales bacterium]